MKTKGFWFWIVALSVSILFNIVCILQFTTFKNGRECGQIIDSLRGNIFQQASISYNDVRLFTDYLKETIGLSGEICALIPPFACSQCVFSSIEQLNQIGFSVILMVPHGQLAESLPPLSAFISTIEYDLSDLQNPVCYYPDLIFIITRDGEVVDFYLHNKDIPEAMSVFLSHSGD
ncbi:MAG: hypothetical protein II841_00615 [Bacteroidales bacterium]|nr:hypothetical protein [Bacteroidales bacterium]